ncbi:MAG: TFIIB-type zinc ribbon-containing protein [Methanobacteriaceae archaeon]
MTCKKCKLKIAKENGKIIYISCRLIDIYFCVECNSTDIIREKDKINCAKCGLVINENLPDSQGLREDFPANYML